MKSFIFTILLFFSFLPVSYSRSSSSSKFDRSVSDFPNPTQEQLDKLPEFIRKSYLECFEPLTEKEAEYLGQLEKISIKNQMTGDIQLRKKFCDADVNICSAIEQSIGEKKYKEDLCLLKKLYPNPPQKSEWEGFKNPIFQYSATSEKYPFYFRLTPAGYYSGGERDKSFTPYTLIDESENDFLLVRKVSSPSDLRKYPVPIYNLYYASCKLESYYFYYLMQLFLEEDFAFYFREVWGYMNMPESQHCQAWDDEKLDLYRFKKKYPVE